MFRNLNSYRPSNISAPPSAIPNGDQPWPHPAQPQRGALRFHDKLIAGAPFLITATPIAAAAFMVEFEAAYPPKKITLAVLPPNRMKMNGAVERMQATWRNEFTHVQDTATLRREGHQISDATIGRLIHVGLQPPHDLYIESHLGDGALMRRKAPALRSVGVDLDRRALDGFACGYPVELVHGCAHAFLAGFPFRGTELVYSDPPYLRATRRSRRRYRHDYTGADHVALLDLLRGLPCQVMVSGHPSALYDGILEGWRRVAWQVTTQARVRTEVVWLNFAPGRTERDRPAAHQAVMAAIMDVEAE